ncbi:MULTISPECIES: glycoside hydrolase family 3 N-terminal domain-containing protein [unclassified Oscillibacter]|uniref:glycoside hydrolase family 3 N-terminal domain-containing protein n=1 Tax=unclassified Oscillibacter TaxID=2629304 RepID=UPI0025D5ACEC|nr:MULTISPECIES: glycoside hydrolase family 3 N-terminal domain-containing protein [unclassified Oscillibacter]
MKRLLCSLLAASSLFTMTACGGPSPSTSLPDPAHSAGSGSGSASEEPTPPLVDEKKTQIDALLTQMTIEEKVGQLFFARVPETDAAADVANYHLGGYILFGRDTKDKTANDLIQTINSYQEAASIPLLIGVDEEGGSVVRVSSNPHLRARKFSSPQQLYAAGGMDAIIQDTHEKDVLLKALGFNVNLAPVADVSTNSGDFIYDRSFGQDAVSTAEYVRAVVGQMRKDGMGSVLKHFPGYGNNVDTHTGIAIDKRPLETFENSDFLPFTAGLQGGATLSAVLVSHNIVNCMDPNLPASLSPAVHETLRNLMAETGFENTVVMTDDLVMDAVKAYAENGSAAVMALQAGNDLLIATDYRAQIPQVLAAAADGTLDEPTINLLCTQVLQWKQALGLI